jgi:lipopolysaccharide transport system permease protein
MARLQEPAFPPVAKRETTIEAGRANREYIQDIWRFRELFYILVWRDILVRYKQTAIGLAWTLFRPLLSALVFALVFGKMVNVPSGGNPHAPFIYVALVPWLFFAATISDVSASLIAHASLISKVYFPRLLSPFVATVVALIDMLIALALLVPMLWAFGIPLSWRLVAIVPLVLLTTALALGLGLCFAALNVKYRDTGLIVPYLLQFGLYLSPIIFPSDLVPYPWRLLYSLNPIVGVIEGFRWAAFPNQDVHSTALAISILSAVLFLILGFRNFRRMERNLADVI